MARVLISGCGYVGLSAARLFFRGGYDVVGLVASEASAQRLAGGKFPIHVADVTDPESLRPYAGGFDAVVHCAAPVSDVPSVEDYRRVYLDGVRNLAEVVQAPKLLFTSSTSVYGQQDGGWVDEDSPAEPATETSKILRQAEEFVLDRGGFAARLAGIYGPGRSAYIRKFLDGSAAIEGDGSRIVNQIHRDDAAGAIFYLIAWHCPGGIYNIADDSPVPQAELYRWLADHFSRPMPPSSDAVVERRRGVTNKRVSNAKLHQQGWRCKYPSFREAVAEIAPGLVEAGRSGKILRPLAAVSA